MARIEDLLTKIEDPALRAELEREVSALKEHVGFGLVFERHIPETVDLLYVEPVVGDLVRLRRAEGDKLYRVFELTRRSATLTPLDGGETVDVASADLLVVKPFGEPVYPALTPLGSVVRSDERPFHAVINGENLHALQLLRYLYEGQVDCIYIDPPYNTGARDWKYNNRFVDENDAYRHSKWLAMMERRLRLAKRLLKADGVLVVTIDEHELYHLGMLLEELFPRYLRHMVTIVISAQGNASANFSRVEEHAIFCVSDSGFDLIEGSPTEFLPGADELDVVEDEDEEEDEPEADHYLTDDEASAGFVSENARRRGTESMRADRPKMFYPIYIDEEEREVVAPGPPIELDEEPDMSHVDGLRPVWPIDSNGAERRWRWGYETMLRLIEAGEMRVGKYNAERDTWTINRVQPKNVEFRKLKTVWRHTSHAAGTHGSGLLARFLGRGVSFSFPKSIYATRDCLAAVCRSRPDALIVDFFAGSGTTLHSTLLMNEADGGRRRCILVTNNEVAERAAKRLKKKGINPGDPEFEADGVFESVAHPRVQAAITGLRPDGQPVVGSYLGGRAYADGFEENVEFYRLDYLDPDKVELGQAFEAIHPALWLIAGGKAPRPDDVDTTKPFYVAEGAGYAISSTTPPCVSSSRRSRAATKSRTSSSSPTARRRLSMPAMWSVTAARLR